MARRVVLSLAYCKIFWMGMGVRGTSLLPISLPISQFASSTGMPDQREGNYVWRHPALPKRPNLAASPACGHILISQTLCRYKARSFIKLERTKRFVMCLAYCKIFWMGMGVRGEGAIGSAAERLPGAKKTFFQKRFPLPPEIPSPPPASRACARIYTTCPIWIAKDSFLKNRNIG